MRCATTDHCLVVLPSSAKTAGGMLAASWDAALQVQVCRPSYTQQKRDKTPGLWRLTMHV